MFVIGENLPEVLKAGQNLQNEMKTCLAYKFAGPDGFEDENYNFLKMNTCLAFKFDDTGSFCPLFHL